MVSRQSLDLPLPLTRVLVDLSGGRPFHCVCDFVNISGFVNLTIYLSAWHAP